MMTEGEVQVNGLSDLGYRAFLLRCWQEATGGHDDEPVWRFGLVQAGHEGSGRGFASLEALMAFLHEELGSVPPAQPD